MIDQARQQGGPAGSRSIRSRVTIVAWLALILAAFVLPRHFESRALTHTPPFGRDTEGRSPVVTNQAMIRIIEQQDKTAVYRILIHYGQLTVFERFCFWNSALALEMHELIPFARTAKSTETDQVVGEMMADLIENSEDGQRRRLARQQDRLEGRIEAANRTSQRSAKASQRSQRIERLQPRSHRMAVSRSEATGSSGRTSGEHPGVPTKQAPRPHQRPKNRKRSERAAASDPLLSPNSVLTSCAPHGTIGVPRNTCRPCRESSSVQTRSV